MAKTGYVKIYVTGGSAATSLEGIDGNLLLQDDFAFVGESNDARFYFLSASDGGAASPPDRVAPLTNPGTKMWILQNLVSQNMISTGFTATSTTSMLIETASKTFTVEVNKAFVVGMSVKIADTAAPGTNWMHGEVTAHTPATGELTVIVTLTNGSGTKADWTVSLSAPVTTLTYGSFPAGTTMLFYADTAPLSWTLLNTLDDKLVYVTKGSASGGQTGGTAHSSGTWTQPSHTHSGTNHTHTVTAHTHTGPNHTHTGPNHNHTGPSHTHTVSGNTAQNSMYYNNIVAGSDSGIHGQHYHGINITSAAGGTGATGAGGTEATGAGGTGATGSGGSGTTDAGGTGNTGSSATANTWRPSCYSMILCSKD